tara:strand:- start:208 stop:843 length:636 start_codon:yes stop_codon:yes gene_type:complete
MKPEYIVYCIAIIVLVTYIYNSAYNPNLIHVKSTYDNQTYLVQNKPDKLEAANLFAQLREKIELFVSKLKEKYGTSDERVNRFLKKFKIDAIREAVPNSNQTSYTINKGEKIIVCVRSRNSENKLTDLNTILFVVLHELAHIMTISIGHKEEFWENFKFILAHAIKWNIYKAEDYNSNPKPYCGIKITDSPLKNEEIPKYIKSTETRESFR